MGIHRLTSRKYHKSRPRHKAAAGGTKLKEARHKGYEPRLKEMLRLEEVQAEAKEDEPQSKTKVNHGQGKNCV
ncbi:hypothetical protein E3N88_37096 [Mikania micrantha]|uniref:Uncharacterized protein n=1 Tax=Mikania micrantha TaxID=192012 RepID=A0A5N6M6N8_9ASTR|nr:hypothetical protein E3N88_37096 [Mikania micrantha]